MCEVIFMVRHVIIWKLDEACDAEKVKREAKENLEALVGKIEGLVSLKVETEALPSSSGDMLLDSTFESAEALAFYSGHPLHVKAADTYVRPFAKVRLSFDV